MGSITTHAEETQAQIRIVAEQKAAGVLVVPEGASDQLRSICGDFIQIVEESTGARLRLISEAEVGSLTPAEIPIYVGPSKAAEAAGLDADLKAEEYRIAIRPKAVYLLGADNAAPVLPQKIPSQPLRWALNRLLDDHLGVRFLWPGKLGTHVPERTEFTLPVSELSGRPPLEIRNLRLPFNYPDSSSPQILTLQREATVWSMNHQVGRRVSFLFGHAFIDWWDKYGAEHPEYFSLTPPPGEPKPDPKAPSYGKTMKLRLSNPAVIEQIAKEYEEAGAPLLYNICPNDHGRFDISPETLAWDDPAGQPLDDIWKGMPEINLTSRYVRFWNLIAERLQKINPEVTLLSYGYMAYRFPPKEGTQFAGPIKIALVDSWDSFDTWNGWKKSGAELYLRPNWGFSAGPAPLLPLKEIHAYLSHTLNDGLRGFDLDSIIGNWASEGLTTYVMARITQRPELSLEAIVEEYTSAFGSAAPKVRAYIDYWQEISSRMGYASLAGFSSGPGGGEYRRLQEERKIGRNYFAAPYEALPLLYQDDLLAPAFKLLDEAAEAADTDLAKARVAFLRSGLENTRMTRDLIELGTKIRRMRKNEDKTALMKQFHQQALELDRFRQSITQTHAIWADSVKTWEIKAKLPSRL